jgi:predicted Fe-Mo cluster-binding NifX family protein
MNVERKVTVACESGDGLAGQVSGHFGRTPYFVVATLDGEEVVDTTLVPSPGHGPGCGMPDFVRSLGVCAVIVSGIGGGAIAGLGARGIEIVAGAGGNARAALAAYAKGELSPAEPGCHGHGDHGPCHHHH